VNVIDLFSGPGGLALGLKRAGYHIIANVESNWDAMETYSLHEGDAVHIHQDVRTVSFEPYRRVVDLVVGGPPCQPFSIGGLRKAQTDARDMIPEFVRCLRECQPVAFIMENVPGLLFKQTQHYLIWPFLWQKLSTISLTSSQVVYTSMNQQHRIYSVPIWFLKT
jgi:DNA (cytosine-5)-methyltransferase 1